MKNLLQPDKKWDRASLSCKQSHCYSHYLRPGFGGAGFAWCCFGGCGFGGAGFTWCGFGGAGFTWCGFGGAGFTWCGFGGAGRGP